MHVISLPKCRNNLYVCFLQHIALIIMFIFAYIVPDTPADVALKKRKVHVLLFR